MKTNSRDQEAQERRSGSDTPRWVAESGEDARVRGRRPFDNGRKEEIPKVIHTRALPPRGRLRIRTGSSLATLLLGLALAVAAALGVPEPVQSTEPGDPEGHLIRSLRVLQRSGRDVSLAEAARRSGDLVTLAARRQRLLAELIQDDPGAVLEASVPAEVRASLPAAVQTYVEAEVELEGELEVLHEDRDPGSRYLYFLKNKEERFSLHFAAHPPTLQTGSWVRVRGIRVERALALESGSAGVVALSVVLPYTFGERRTLVLLVNFQDKPNEQPYTRDFARDVVFGTASQFIWEASYLHTWLTGEVQGWYTIPLNSTICDPYQLASAAKAVAESVGVNLTAYTSLVYAFPSNACGWWGTGTVGGAPSETWINGSLQVHVVAHELGHNLGLYHSRALNCGTQTIGNNCTVLEYGDPLDVMGMSTGHYNAFQKERLGWLNYGTTPAITTVEADGTYWLDPYEASGANPKALKILKGRDPTTGQRTWYYVEYRQAIGFDSFLAGNANVLNGVVIHTGSEATANSSNLLNLTPTTSSSSDPALAVGQSFYDPDAGVTIAPIWASSANAAILVTFGAFDCLGPPSLESAYCLRARRSRSGRLLPSR